MRATPLMLGMLVAALCVTKVPAQPPKVGTITFMVGGANDVTIRSHEAKEWVPARLKMDVFEGDVLHTAKESRVEITLLDKSVLRIGEQSELQLTKAVLTKKNKQVQSELNRGRLWVNITQASGSRNFQVKAPTAVCAVRGTVYRVDADSTTTVLVYDGVVDIGPLSKVERQPETPRRSLEPHQIPGPYEVPPPYQVTLEEWIRIVKGFQVTVRQDGKYYKRRFNEEEDAKLEWVRWNKERDRQVRAR